MKKWLLLLIVGLFLNGCATLQRNDISLETFCKKNSCQVNDVVFEWFPVSINDWWLYEGYLSNINKFLSRKVYVKNITTDYGVTLVRMEYEDKPYRIRGEGELFRDEWIHVYENRINFGASLWVDCIEFPLKAGTSDSPLGPKEWIISQEQSKNKYLDKSFKLQLYQGNKHPVILTRWYKKGIGVVKYTTEKFDKSTNKYVVTTEFILKDCSINLLNK